MSPVAAKKFQAIVLSASPNLNQEPRKLCGAKPPAGTIFTRGVLSSGPKARKGRKFAVSIGESRTYSTIRSSNVNSGASIVAHLGRVIQNHLLALRQLER